jgi:hypothetical protein
MEQDGWGRKLKCEVENYHIHRLLKRAQSNRTFNFIGEKENSIVQLLQNIIAIHQPWPAIPLQKGHSLWLGKSPHRLELKRLNTTFLFLIVASLQPLYRFQSLQLIF